jgi:outer membrane lipoprotein SlyB
MVGGGAVLGTLLGALAGGGKGAAIGAVAGAAAGGSVQVLTKGREIRVPAETVLNFRLEEPLHLHEAR